METEQIVFLIINAVGGVAVLGSYVHGIKTHPRPADTLWGGVPRWLRPWYGVSMLLAALGFLGFLAHLSFFVAPETVTLPGGYLVYLLLAGLILVPSVLWMPLTFRFAARPGASAWWEVRAVLLLVALGSTALLAALLATRPEPVTASWLVAVVGAALFTFHVGVLDALLWPALYRRAR